MTTRRSLLRHAALRAVLGILALLLLALAAPAGAQALGAYLHSVGYTVTVWVDADDPQQVDHGRFDPTVLASDLPGCFLGRPACIRAFNRRYGSAAGGGRQTAPWRRFGDLVGERGCTAGEFCDPLIKFFDRVGLPQPPTDLDAEDAKLVAGAWDGLIVPGGSGLINPPGSSPDPCAAWIAQFQAWLSQAPAPPSGLGACTTWEAQFQAWLLKMPPPAPLACAAPPQP
jgi:hypothetical protein